MIRKHAENIYNALHELSGTNGTRDGNKVTQLLSTALTESENLVNVLNGVEDIEESYKELKLNYDGQSDIIEGYINENRELKEKIGELKTLVENYESTSVATRDVQEKLQKENEELSKRCAELEGKINVANENNSPMNREIFKSLQKIETELSKATCKIDANNKAINGNSKDVSKLEKAVNNLVKSNEDVEEVTQVYSETLKDLRDDINITQDAIEEVKEEQDEIKLDFEDVKEEVAESNNIASDAKLFAEEAKKEAKDSLKLFEKIKGIFRE